MQNVHSISLVSTYEVENAVTQERKLKGLKKVHTDKILYLAKTNSQN